MRRSGDEQDPVRWRRIGVGDRSESASRLASDVRALPEPVDLDDVRLAQIRQRIVQSGASATRRPMLSGWSWPRATAFALVFLILGSLTTAMAARLYLRRLERSVAAGAKPNPAVTQLPARDKARRWRMAVRESSQLELSVGPDGAQIAVMDGRAEITGPQLASPVVLTPGGSWSEGTTGSEASPGTPTPSIVEAAAVPVVPLVRTARPENRPRLALAPAARLPETQDRPSSPAPSLRVPEPPAPAMISPPVEPPPFPTPPVVATGRPQTSMAIAAPRMTRTPTVFPEAPAEAFLVAGALRSLRSDRSPIEALAKLDEHRRRFPSGVLHREAALARVEALLGLGRNDEALGVLEPLTLNATGTDRKVLLARAELRADRGRCVQAVVDLSRILIDSVDDDLAARALYGRARCEMRARNTARARVDLRDYMVRFPDGPKKLEAEALLRRLGG